MTPTHKVTHEVTFPPSMRNKVRRETSHCLGVQESASGTGGQWLEDKREERNKALEYSAVSVLTGREGCSRCSKEVPYAEGTFKRRNTRKPSYERGNTAKHAIIFRQSN